MSQLGTFHLPVDELEAMRLCDMEGVDQEAAMRLCIPTMDNRGLEAVPSDRFGGAPFFTLVDTETERIEVVPNANCHHEYGECDPLRNLESERIDLVVCQGLGRRAITLLSEAGIPFFITWKPDVAAILAAHREGQLGQEASTEAGHGGPPENRTSLD